MRSSETLVCPLCASSPGPQALRVCPNDGRLFVPRSECKKSPKDRYLGTCLAGKYPLLGILGIGGMSTVYKGIQEPVGREVAIKVVPPDADNVNAARQRFQQEAQVIARLQHPNIVTLFDFGVEPDGTLFMVQERVEGPDLSEVIRHEGPLGLERTGRIILQVLAALAEAHGKNLVHRDLKPDNIMLTPTTWGGEQAKVLDFGIARFLERSPGASSERLTRAGIIFGTPDYMSPEQVAGNAEIGFPSDVYSLGIVIYEMLSGKVPFNAPSFIELLIAHREQELPGLPPNLGVPPGVEAVIRRATSKQPAQRYPHAGEMLRAWEAAMAGAGYGASLGVGGAGAFVPGPPGPPGPPGKGSEDAQPARPPFSAGPAAAALPVTPAPPNADGRGRVAHGPRDQRAAHPAQGRGTLFLGDEEQQPVTAAAQRTPRASWARQGAQAAPSIHNRPTLVVEEESLALERRHRSPEGEPPTARMRLAPSERGLEPQPELAEPTRTPPPWEPPLAQPAEDLRRPLRPLPSDPMSSSGAATTVLPVEHFAARGRDSWGQEPRGGREAVEGELDDLVPGPAPPTLIEKVVVPGPSRPADERRRRGSLLSGPAAAWLLLGTGLLVLAAALVLLISVLR